MKKLVFILTYFIFASGYAFSSSYNSFEIPELKESVLKSCDSKLDFHICEKMIFKKFKLNAKKDLVKERLDQISLLNKDMAAEIEAMRLYVVLTSVIEALIENTRLYHSIDPELTILNASSLVKCQNFIWQFLSKEYLNKAGNKIRTWINPVRQADAFAKAISEPSLKLTQYIAKQIENKKIDATEAKRFYIQCLEQSMHFIASHNFRHNSLEHRINWNLEIVESLCNHYVDLRQNEHDTWVDSFFIYCMHELKRKDIKLKGNKISINSAQLALFFALYSENIKPNNVTEDLF